MRLLITLLGLIFILFVNAQKVTRKEAVKTQLLTESPNFRIDSIIYYCNPFITNYFEPVEKDYVPAWIQPFLVSNRPDLFNDYINSALKYSHSSMSQDTTVISEAKKNKIGRLIHTKSTNKNQPLYGYTFSEIWFTELEKKVTVVAVLIFYKHDSIPMNINLLNDSLSVNNTGIELFVWDNNLLKRMGSKYYTLLELDKYRYWKFNDFKEILVNVPLYQRSFIVSGKRIFETVKNSPNGPVVVDKNGNIIGGKPWYLKYWWALAAGLIIVALLVFLIRRKINK